MKKYFSYFSYSTATQNQLQKEANTLLKEQSNLLVTDSKKFLNDLCTAINKLNLKHHRCAPLNFSHHYIHGEDTIIIGLGSRWSVHFYLYKIKEEQFNS